jgi:intraflagellar transport protein 20
MLDSHSNKLENEKLKALGKKNQVAEEIESRNQKEQELKTMIREKKQEFERLKTQYQSLLKIENEQKMIIEKLSNNDDQ